MENESLDKIQKYGENIRKTEIQSFITLKPGRISYVPPPELVAKKYKFNWE